MSRMKLFALEDEMIGGVNETTGSESAAAASVAEEVDTETSSIEETALSVTDGIEATQELGEVKGVMDQSIEAGTGLDPVAAEMARISIRNILSKIGAEHYAGGLIVASESFGSTSSRLANTRYASENTDSFIGRIWEQVKIFFSNMWNKIKDFVVGLFNKEKAIKGAIDRLTKKLSDAELSGKSKKISVKGKLGGFVFNQRTTLLTKAEIAKFIERHKATKSVLSTLLESAKLSLEVLAGGAVSENQITDLFDPDTFLETSGVNSVGSVKGDKLTLPESDTFYGGLSAEITVSSSGKFKGKFTKGLNVLNMADSTHFKAEEVELSGSVSEIKDLLGKTKDLIEGNGSLKKEGKIIETSIQSSITTITKKVKSSANENDNETVKSEREIMVKGLNAIKKAVGYNTRIFTIAASANFKLAAAVIYYAEICMFENSDRYVSQTEKDN